MWRRSSFISRSSGCLGPSLEPCGVSRVLGISSLSRHAFRSQGDVSKARSLSSRESFFRGLFHFQSWASLLYDGKWENTFKKLSIMNRFLTGKRGAALFEAKTLDEQLQYLENRFPTRAWNLVLRLLGNASVFNALLYKGHCAKKNFPESFPKFYMNRSTSFFSRGPRGRIIFCSFAFSARCALPRAIPSSVMLAFLQKRKKLLRRLKSVTSKEM